MREIGRTCYTLDNPRALISCLEYLKQKQIRSMIDIDSANGLLTKMIMEYLGVEKAYGIERNQSLVKIAKSHFGDEITFIEKDFLEMSDPDMKVDLVTCFGVLEHNIEWDVFIDNVNKFLDYGSHILIQVPNLGGWMNRASLLLGYQPISLEISQRKLYGVSFGKNSNPMRSAPRPIGHIKMATYRAWREFLEDNDLRIVRVEPVYSSNLGWINFVDKILSPFPGMARRLIILAQNRAGTTGDGGPGGN